ncbi:MAG: protein kinase [Myxococcaceae bacterium]|nr:protein kinase [Myxococcaceae bacterium]
MTTGSSGGDFPPREPVGQVAVRPFGAYFLVRKLAEGGMAEIFLAKQMGVEGFERNVVIKRMLQHLSNVPDFVSMFLDEARLASRLAHPNIVQINDLGFADGCYFISMEYLPGEDFSTVLRTSARRREYVPYHVSLRVIAEAARGLHYAHEFTDAKGKPLNIVHRDISPSNIFVSYTGQVKVLDFGIAKAESRVTNTTAGVVKGKYMYMSPEQASSGAVDRRADIFSLGVSMYEALTNTRPFARDSDLAILNAVLRCDFKVPRAVRPDLPVELEQIALKAMSHHPEDRYQTAEEMAADLERFLAATTSGSGGATLSSFMASFFGPERLASKTRIESLNELAAKGVDVPGFSNPLSPKTDPDHTQAGVVPQSLKQGTPALGPKPLPGRQDSKGRGAVLMAIVAALVAAAMAGAFWVGGLVRNNELQDAGGVNTSFDSGAVVATPDAGPEAAVDAGAIATDAGKRVEVPVPACVTLTERIILGVARNHFGAVQRCFQDNKDDLPANAGQLSVEFTIAPNGRVSRAKPELGNTGVGKCMERVVKGMVFPCQKEKQPAVLTLPFQYEVKR